MRWALGYIKFEICQKNKKIEKDRTCDVHNGIPGHIYKIRISFFF
jgi:hypothetical protein